MTAYINNWSDLSKYGINCLTGEACAYSMRLLCDLNEDGIELLCNFFGMSYVEGITRPFSKNWNSQVNNKPAVSSVMLPRGVFEELCRFALFSRDHCDYVVENLGGAGYVGYTEAYLKSVSHTAESMSRIYQGRMWRNPKNPANSVGDRNVHAFTGRTT